MEVIRDFDRATPIEPNVATIGFFDGVHPGHSFLIRQVKEVAKKRGLRSGLITFPVHPRKVMQSDFQPRLLSTLEEKIGLLSRTGVDYCFLIDFTPELSRLSAREFMQHILKEKLNVQALVIGYDHRFGHNRSEGFEDYCRYGREMGMEIIRASACEIAEIPVSSSVVRSFLQKGEIETATRCLGYEYALEGTVVGGYKVGRTIGYPTANLHIKDPAKLVPADGVYAVRVWVGGKEYMGMLDIGHRPTLGNGADKSIEVHILDFSSDIYDQPVRVSFVHRIRSDIKFSTIDGLIAQLRRDEAEVRRLLSC